MCKAFEHSDTATHDVIAKLSEFIAPEVALMVLLPVITFR